MRTAIIELKNVDIELSQEGFKVGDQVDAQIRDDGGCAYFTAKVSHFPGMAPANDCVAFKMDYKVIKYTDQKERKAAARASRVFTFQIIDNDDGQVMIDNISMDDVYRDAGIYKFPRKTVEKLINHPAKIRSYSCKGYSLKKTLVQ